MKKIKYLLLALALLLVLPFKVYAAGGISLSTTSLTIEKGKSATFKVTANNAAGRIDISSSNAGIASVNKSSVFLDKDSVTVTVTAKEVGSTTINVVLTDVSTFDEEEKTGTLTVSINVTEPKKEEPAPSNNTNTNTNNNNNKKTTKTEEVKEEPVVVEKELNEEPVISEAEQKYNKALDLVKKAEKTKQIEDVNKAREAVEELEMSEAKYKLLNRLLTVMFNIDNNVKEEIEEVKDGTKITTSAKGTSISWLFLSIVLLICLAIETIYIILFERKKKEEEKAEVIVQ